MMTTTMRVEMRWRNRLYIFVYSYSHNDFLQLYNFSPLRTQFHGLERNHRQAMPIIKTEKFGSGFARHIGQK
jgi:hypothetical protein